VDASISLLSGVGRSGGRRISLGAAHDAGNEHRALAAEICIEITFRNFGAPRDFERAGSGVTVFDESRKCSAQDALLHKLDPSAALQRHTRR